MPKEYSVSVLVDLKDTHTFTKTVPISLPPNVVADSTRARVTAIGQCDTSVLQHWVLCHFAFYP